MRVMIVSSSGFFRTLIKVGSYNLSLILYNFFLLFFRRIEVIRSG